MRDGLSLVVVSLIVCFTEGTTRSICLVFISFKKHLLHIWPSKCSSAVDRRAEVPQPASFSPMAGEKHAFDV